jgi:hypothetical protein
MIHYTIWIPNLKHGLKTQRKASHNQEKPVVSISVEHFKTISYIADSPDIPRLISYLSWTVMDRSFKHNTCFHNWRPHWNNGLLLMFNSLNKSNLVNGVCPVFEILQFSTLRYCSLGKLINASLSNKYRLFPTLFVVCLSQDLCLESKLCNVSFMDDDIICDCSARGLKSIPRDCPGNTTQVIMTGNNLYL